MKSPVRLISITHGADFEIDLSAFPEAEPVFAYVDDVEGGVEPLGGLVLDGTMTITGRPDFMWLKGTRECVRLRATTQGRMAGRASFRSLGVGEFCLEIYHVGEDSRVQLLHQDDFCFK